MHKEEARNIFNKTTKNNTNSDSLTYDKGINNSMYQW